MMSRAAFGGVVWRSELRCSAVKCAPNHGRGNQLYNVYVCRRTVGSFRAVTDRLGERASKILAALASDSCPCTANLGLQALNPMKSMMQSDSVTTLAESPVCVDMRI